MTGPNGHSEELELNANISDALAASIDEAVGELKAETSFATMLTGMGESVRALLADLHQLDLAHQAALQGVEAQAASARETLIGRHRQERTLVEAKLQRIAKALGAR